MTADIFESCLMKHSIICFKSFQHPSKTAEVKYVGLVLEQEDTLGK